MTVELSRTRYVGVPALTEHLVDNQQAFDDALRDDCDILGIDTEFIRVNTVLPDSGVISVGSREPNNVGRCAG